jgi:hypothetical protein
MENMLVFTYYVWYRNILILIMFTVLHLTQLLLIYIRCCFNILGCTVWVPVKCETKRNIPKRNGTKFTETKRNLPKRNEFDAKRNKSKRNWPKRNGIMQNEIKPILTKQFLEDNKTKIKLKKGSFMRRKR